MGCEIELKAHIEAQRVQQLRQKLATFDSYKDEGEVLKEDLYYAFNKKDKALFRIRKEIVNNKQSVLLTSKPTKALNGLTEVNQENEFSVSYDQATDVQTFFEGLGYVVCLKKQKKGYACWIYFEGFDIHVELLDVNNLGWFLEIEIVSLDDINDLFSVTKAQEALYSLLSFLGISEKQIETKSYRSMILESDKMDNVTIYTDGGCSGNPGPGGWAFVILNEANTVLFKESGGERQTTNNKMELTAVISGLKAAKNLGSNQIVVCTDSQYVKNGITSWIFNWKKNGWRNAQKQPVKNKELWEALDEEVSTLKVTFKWVKGHAGIEHNELCDSMVRQEMEKFL